MNILGEILSLLAALTLAYSTFSKKKKKMMLWQALNALFFGLSNFCLAGYSAVVTNVLTFIRNLLVVKNKFDKKCTVIICILIIGIGLHFNNRSIIGLLPIIASVQYTICVFALKSPQHLRWSLVVNLAMWVIFDFVIAAYPAAIMDIVIIIVTIINIIRFRKSAEQNNLNLNQIATPYYNEKTKKDEN